MIGILLQDEKVPGVHLAFGDPYGSQTHADWKSRTHVDVLTRDCDVWIDDEQVIAEGQYLLEKFGLSADRRRVTGSTDHDALTLPSVGSALIAVRLRSRMLAYAALRRTMSSLRRSFRVDVGDVQEALRREADRWSSTCATATPSRPGTSRAPVRSRWPTSEHAIDDLKKVKKPIVTYCACQSEHSERDGGADPAGNTASMRVPWSAATTSGWKRRRTSSGAPRRNR